MTGPQPPGRAARCPADAGAALAPGGEAGGVPAGFGSATDVPTVPPAAAVRGSARALLDVKRQTRGTRRGSSIIKSGARGWNHNGHFRVQSDGLCRGQRRRPVWIRTVATEGGHPQSWGTRAHAPQSLSDSRRSVLSTTFLLNADSAPVTPLMTPFRTASESWAGSLAFVASLR